MAANEELQTDHDVDEKENSEETKSLSLDVEIESPSACQRHVTVTISREDVDRYFEEAFNELMPKASVPGFRTGRAPRKLVETRFRKDMADQVKGSILLDTMNQVTEQQKFSAINEPDFDFDAVEVPDDGPMTFEFDIEVRPEFDLPDWKGLRLEKPTKKFTKKDVDNQLERLLSKHGHMTPSEEPVASGDFVVVNIRSNQEGRLVEQQDELTIRVRPVLSFRDCRLPDFDALMKGVQEGDIKTAQITLSDSAPNREMRGEQVSLEFEVLGVKKLDLPELTEDLMSQLGPYENEDQLREAIEEALERQLVYHQQQQVRQQITSTLVKSADWELPPDLLQRQSGRELERAVLELRSSGFPEDVIRAHENELRQNTLTTTAKALKEHFILERIAEEETVEATDDDYDREIKMIAAQRDESPRRLRARLEKTGGMDALRNQIIERIVVEQIQAHAEFQEIDFTGFDDEVEAVEFTVGGGVDDPNIPEAKHAPDGQSLRQPVDHK